MKVPVDHDGSKNGIEILFALKIVNRRSSKISCFSLGSDVCVRVSILIGKWYNNIWLVLTVQTIKPAFYGFFFFLRQAALIRRQPG